MGRSAAEAAPARQRWAGAAPASGNRAGHTQSPQLAVLGRGQGQGAVGMGEGMEGMEQGHEGSGAGPVCGRGSA